MRPRLNIGVVLLLAALILLGASGVCAAVMARSSEPSHPCCPQPPSTAPSLGCCEFASIPAVTPSLPRPAESDDAAPVSSSDIVPVVWLAPAEAIATAGDRCHPPLLFIRLHQLLI